MASETELADAKEIREFALAIHAATLKLDADGAEDGEVRE